MSLRLIRLHKVFDIHSQGEAIKRFPGREMIIRLLGNAKKANTRGQIAGAALYGGSVALKDKFT